MQSLYQRLDLYIDGEDSYTFAPVDSPNARSLTIFRNSGDIVLNPPNAPLPQRPAKTVYGILGIISLSLSEYIILLTGRELNGTLMSQQIYRMTEFEILPLQPHASVTHPSHPVEAHLLALVKSHFDAGLFWFSYGWGLTRRLQVQWESRDHDEGRALWEVADERFFWNKYLHTKFIDITTADPKQDLSPYILPIIYGTFDIRPSYINSHHLRLCLISRRSRHRAGTRYFRRGIDHSGNVANFNETEQLVLVERGGKGGDEGSVKMSFIQTRGSIPVFWAEVNNLRYKPDLQVMELQDTADAAKKHLEGLVAQYGEQSLVSLVNHKGHERPVKEAYEKTVAELSLPDVKYNYFDFHTECKHMRWERISVLIEKLEKDLVKQGYFYLDPTTSPTPLLFQKGTVRTNCMDNLDRTNVAQAAFAKWTLNRQLRDVGVFKGGEGIEMYEELERDFREMWSDHADLISNAYAGSGALKVDYTRTGKRTKTGAMEDGYKGALRYMKNNFFDGPRQDGFDLVTGVWVPRRGPSFSGFLLADDRPLVVRAMPYVLFFSIFMICAGLTLPRTSEYSLFYYFTLWLTLLSLSLIFIFIHGIDYVSWPRLIPPTEIIHYEGPGFRSAHNGKGMGWEFGKVRAGRKGMLSEKGGGGVGRKRASSRLEEIEMGKKRDD
ncbi:hypothetical protein JAAARDRAFT_37897 [Jaapia argillacea MUCL 33604]|uniref:SAC domain-containing protein n=1 Tax=Jaapia argillacea MUCL 33604 TaxID=933084 RepID=A0A067PIQ5_9AGAM|nr:hypothetical protein JAAARDRAFT_37897 [Jaapia argillacea MUCL 33604]